MEKNSAVVIGKDGQPLKGFEKVLYKTTYDFYMKHIEGATHESSHEAGLEKLESVNRTRKMVSQFRH